MTDENSSLVVPANVGALNRFAYEPATWAAAREVAKELVEGGFLPPGIDSVPKALTVMALGRELGLSMMQSFRAIHIIDGKPALAAQLMMSLVINSGKCEFFEMLRSTSEACTYETHRKGNRNPQSITWTLEDADRAGLLRNEKKPNWRRYPAAMLRNRCIAELARAVYPDVVLGLYDPDELNGPIIDVTPTSIAPPTTALVVTPKPVAQETVVRDEVFTRVAESKVEPPPPSPSAAPMPPPAPPVSNQEMYAAYRALKNAGEKRELVALSREKYGKNPDALTPEEKAEFLANLRARVITMQARTNGSGNDGGTS